MQDSDSEEKRKKKVKTFNKKTVYCINCGIGGHTSKICNKPTTSFGIICIKIDSDEDHNSIHTKLSSMKDTIKGINYNNENDIKNFGMYRDKIKFLLIRRKHSLGFMEFVRGRYSIDNIDAIIYLFKQMVTDEIEKISKYTFDELWEDLWGVGNQKDYEYDKAKEKFLRLKEGGDNFLNLEFYTLRVKPQWGSQEWGFPKGRRNNQETDRECAIREFEEESDLKRDEYVILGTEPKSETFTGTNGKLYKHTYYIAYANKDIEAKINPKNKTQNDEIGDIKWLTYYEAIENIRPYHSERIKILSELYMAIVNTLIGN